MTIVFLIVLGIVRKFGFKVIEAYLKLMISQLKRVMTFLII